MYNSKGISMISLIVTIIAITILSSIAIGTGSRYIRESKAKEREIFINVMSSAVARRHDDTNLNSISYPYIGYHINDSVMFENVFAPKVKEKIFFENGTWYVIDTVSAKELGVIESEKYIDKVDTSNTEEIKVAMVDYKSAKVYLIEVRSSEIASLGT